MDQVKIGCFLKELRRRQGLTQEQQAKRMSVSNRTVSRWETGAKLPDIALPMELSGLYQVEVQELLNGQRVRPVGQDLRQTVYQLSDYSGSRYQAMLRQFCVLFCVTTGFAVLALAMEFVPAPEGSTAAHVCEFLRGLGMGMSIGMLVVGPWSPAAGWSAAVPPSTAY